MALKTEDGGKGLIEDHLLAAEKHGIEIFFDTAATKLVTNPKTGAVTGVELISRAFTGDDSGSQVGQKMTIQAKAVIMAAGGFEANPQLRAQYLGPRWDAARVRCTPYNTGDLLQIAQRDVFAKALGNWSGCHSVAWDADAPAYAGDRAVSNERFHKDGARFADEGSYMRNYTYAMIGRRILEQPEQIAFQVWDARTTPWLRSEEYRPEVARHLTGESLGELADRCVEAGLADDERFLATLSEYNRSLPSEEIAKDKWDPGIKDGLTTKGLPVPKSNWALPIDRAPFLAVRVTTGITFTFGGLTVNPNTAAVVSEATGAEIPACMQLARCWMVFFMIITREVVG
ncbi:hypothetical protein PENSUB_9621 [Penicillium subrubescens]|uniref:FAD-dependent oxidoreductase 2 FAD-binding domain-containing protein n=1 Tax=Penicillium subrubescens TaxID=1316194 RepID=A0A1Q5TCV0_9EURO|nr:hypothetical protein PENSUB_9621 [Penicillium subrubescens]